MKTTGTKSAKFLEAQRTKLEALRTHLTRRTVSVDMDLARAASPQETDFEEQAVARENDEVLSALSGEGRAQLVLVEAALARIASGAYGSCERCGQTVMRSRLEALPYATTCVACSKKAETTL